MGGGDGGGDAGADSRQGGGANKMGLTLDILAIEE